MLSPDRFGHGDLRLALEHVPVERHVARLESVVELLAQAGLELGAHAAHGERPLVLLQDAQRNVEPAHIGIDRDVHVRVLQLAGKRAAVVAHGAMHLAERGRGRRRQLEVAKATAPIRAELARHAAAHELGPIGGACDCRLTSSATYSAGRAPGTVASSCATLTTGPRRRPSAVVSSRASAAASPAPR